ncbi:MAG TPA: inositol monophosphatase family protein [Actinomycetota bacterium]|nr:inositol monophosphatase family protein [Actinomycetota bacterium]
MPNPAGDLAALRDLAVDVAHEAGRLLLAARPTGTVRKSSPTDLATDADRAAEALIVKRLLDACPGDSLLAEEGSLREGTSGNRWVIDPLDGTVNFVYGIPMWSVSIGLEGNQRLGVVYDPSRDETFTDAGTELTMGFGRRAVALRASQQTDLSQALVATGFSYSAAVRARQGEIFRRVIPRVRDVRRGGSLALDLAWVACGRLDANYESDIKPWDISAGIALVEAAGGAVWTRDTRIIAAGNRELLDALAGVVLGTEPYP